MDNRLTRDDQHIYRYDGKIIPGVTKILSVLGDYSFVKDEARQFGTVVHDTLHLYDIDDLGSYNPYMESYIRAWEGFKQDHHVRIIHSNLKMYSRIHKFAGEADKIAMVGDSWAVIDIKTGKPAPYVGLQLAAYAELAGIKFGIPYRQIKRIAVHLEGEGYRRGFHTKREDKQEFLTLLYAHNIVEKYKPTAEMQ